MPARPDFEEAFSRLGEFLKEEGIALRLVVVGGAALNLLGLVSRTTTDADVIAVERGGKLVAPSDLPPALAQGAAAVAASLRLSPDWLNTGPALQMRFGLPPGFQERITWLEFDTLHVGLASRLDLITLKLFAAVDHWPARGVHYRDLVALAPEIREMTLGADWVKTQDVSPDFPDLVDAVVAQLESDARQ